MVETLHGFGQRLHLLVQTVGKYRIFRLEEGLVAFVGQNLLLQHRRGLLVDYYFARELFSPDPTVAATARNAIERYSKCNKGPGGAVVIMRSEDEMYDGYRFFIINMLCFTANRFAIGFRTDGGPVRETMTYYKGCRPLGVRTASNGVEWNLIECDASLSDDNFAVFSNLLDGGCCITVSRR